MTERLQIATKELVLKRSMRQVESLRSSEIASPAFMMPYTLRHLWAAEGEGPVDMYKDPFTGKMLHSGEITNLQFQEGAFSIPKDPAPLRKLCHTFGVKPPTSSEEIPEFVRSQIEDIKDSTGRNTHFENATVLGVLFPKSENEKQVLSFIKDAEAPEKPNSCSDIEGIVNGQKMSFHLHAAYEGNNKRVLTMFALLGHEPSKALLAKWVEKDFIHEHGACEHNHAHDHNHTDDVKEASHSVRKFQGTPEVIAEQMANEIIARKEIEVHNTEHKESEKIVEMTSEERIDSVASVTFAKVIDEQNENIKDAFEQVTNNNYLGRIELGHKEAEPVIRENKVLTENLEETLQAFRKQFLDNNETDIDSEKMSFRLAQLHDQSIKQVELQKVTDYPPSNNKEATIILAIAMEIKTRAKEGELTKTEKQILDSANQIQEVFGVHFVNYTTDHKTNFHKIVQPDGSIAACPEHAKETQALDKSLQKSYETAKEQIKNVFTSKQMQYQPKMQQRTKPIGRIWKDNIKNQLSSKTKPALEMLMVLGNENATKELIVTQERDKLEIRFGEVAKATITVSADIPVDNEIHEVASNEFTGWGKFTENPTDEAKSYNALVTAILEMKVKEERVRFTENKIEIHSEKIIASLESLHHQPIDKAKQQDFAKKFADPTMTLEIFEKEIPKLTHEAFVEIFTKAMEIETRPKEKPLTAYEKKIIKAKTILNKLEKYFANKINTSDHSGWFHGEIRFIKGAPVMDECPEHTPANEKKLKNISQKLENAIQKSIAPKQNIQLIQSKQRLRPLGGAYYNLEPQKRLRKVIKQPTIQSQALKPVEISHNQSPIVLKRVKQQLPIIILPEREVMESKKTIDPLKPAKRKQTKVYLRKMEGPITIRPKNVQVTSNPLNADIAITIGTGIKKPKIAPIVGTTHDVPLARLKSKVVISPIGIPQTVAPEKPKKQPPKETNPKTTRIILEKTSRVSGVSSKNIISSNSTAHTISREHPRQTARNNSASSKEGSRTTTTRIYANTVDIAAPPHTKPVLRIVPIATTVVEQSKPNSSHTESAKTSAISNGVRLKESIQGTPRSSMKNVRVVTEGSPATTMTVAPAKRDNVIHVNFSEGHSSSTIDALPSGTKTTTDSTKASSSITIRRGRRNTTRKEIPTTPSKPTTPDTLDPHDQIASTVTAIKKVDGAKTAEKLQNAFKQKSEQKVEAQVKEQLQQVSTASKQETTERKETTQSSVHHDQTVSETETERTTKIQIAPGVERFGTERISQTQKETAKEDEKIEEKQSTSSQETAIKNQGTNETAQATQSSDSVQTNQTKGLQLNRNHTPTNTQASSTSMSSQLTLDSGEHLPMDPFGAKSALQQTFNEIASELAA